MLGKTAVITVLVSSSYFLSVSLLFKKAIICDESVSNFLPMREARFSFVRILVITRFTGDCLPFLNILATSKRLWPCLISYRPGRSACHTSICVAIMSNDAGLLNRFSLRIDFITSSLDTRPVWIYRNFDSSLKGVLEKKNLPTMATITTASTVSTIIKILNIGNRLPCKINEKPCVLCRVMNEKI